MHENGMGQLGFLAGVAVGCLVGILMLKLMKKDKAVKCKLDERQQIVRGLGFQYGFFGWMIFQGLCIAADLIWEIKLMDMSMMLFCGMMVGTVIYVSYSIWHDGYFSLNENPKRVKIFLIAAAIMNFACAVYRIRHGLLDHGVLTFLNGSNLLMAVVCMILLSVMLVKWMTDRKADPGQTL